MTPYEDSYLGEVAENTGMMLEYASRMGLDLETYWDMFSSSLVAQEMENGNPRFLVGCSAIDLLDLVLNVHGEGRTAEIEPLFEKTEPYWIGWSLAQYQYHTGMSFFDIGQRVPIREVMSLYDPLHEADITKFFSLMDKRMGQYEKETALKRLRKAAFLSQKGLAVKADVLIRNIQMYEQGRNDINKAQGQILFKLSKALGCAMEDLLEPMMPTSENKEK